MKTAKIMLIAITVLAITGGALAFKVRTLGLYDLCTTDLPPGGHCIDQGCAFTSDNFSARIELFSPQFCYSIIPHDIGITCGAPEVKCTLPGANPFED